MNTIRAEKPYEIERNDDHVTIHFGPSSMFATSSTVRIIFLGLAGILLGWIPAFVFSPIGKDFSLFLFLAVWSAPVAGAAAWFTKVKSTAIARGTPATTVLLHQDSISAASWPEHLVYDRADLGTLYSQTPDKTFTYTTGRFSSNYESKKAEVEAQGKVGFSVVADYGMTQVTIVPGYLTEQQSIAIRDLVGKWRDDPDFVIKGEPSRVSA